MGRKKSSSFVPRLVKRAAFVSVVPACVTLGACSSDKMQLGVAAVAFCCFEAGVAQMMFDARADSDAAMEASADAADARSDAPTDARDGDTGG